MTAHHRPRRAAGAAVAALLLVAACGDDARPVAAPADLPVAVERLLADTAGGRWAAEGVDEWEVWVCTVPAGSTAAVYAGLPLRIPLTPDAVAATFERHVVPYYAQLSHGAYRPAFVAGGSVTMEVDDGPQDCIDSALTQVQPTTRGVFAVADAEHGADQPGGFGSIGAPCAAPPCGAATTRRVAYIGASDLHPDWGDRPPMDLVEHELGHALGWPHSGYDANDPRSYTSALDVMSDSAAARTVDPDRRDAPDTLAVNRLTAGWLPVTDVAVIAEVGGTVELSPSTAADGVRVAVIGLDETTFLTVEVLTADGLNSHLPASGVAVHRIDLADPARVAVPRVGSLPFATLLRPGEETTTDGWRIAVTREWTVTAIPAA